MLVDEIEKRLDTSATIKFIFKGGSAILCNNCKDNDLIAVVENHMGIKRFTVDNYDILDGMEVTDNSGETINLETVGNLSLGLNGTYYITYFATDSAGNTASFRRKFVIEPAV